GEPAAEAATPSEPEPFSFDDFGLDAAPAADAATPSEPEPFSLDDFGLDAAPAADAATPSEPEPFSLDDFGLDAAEPEAPAEAATPPSEPELEPFSLSDLGLSPEEIAALEAEQTPAAEAATPSEPEPFSLDDFGLDAAEPAAPAEAPAPPSEPELEPFSLGDLGLSPEEIAMLEQAKPPEPPEQAAPPTPAAPEAPVEPATPDDAAMSPFSLDDLGLSPEEIAMLEKANLGDLPFPATGETIVPGWSKGEEPELTPFSPDEPPPTATQRLDEAPVEDFNFDLLGEDEKQPTSSSAAPGGASEISGDVEPFSLDDFDFDLDSAESFEGGFDESVGDVEPFSLDDLGLGDAGDFGVERRELSVTEEELANLDLGEFETLIPDGGDSAPVYVSDDPAAVLERLINLGRQQGFVDLTDIISVVSDPEAEADRIEELGWALHNAGIEIRDGDEVIDLEGDGDEYEEDYEEEFVAEAPAPEPEPEPELPVSDASDELEPFSFADLDLSPEEIAKLGLEAEFAAPPAPPDPTPAAAPKPPAPPAAPPPAPSVRDEEPELTPFSLADLGLTPEEIALLEQQAGVGTEVAAPEPEPAAPEPEPEPAPEPKAEVPAPPAPAPASDAEPELAPFSLADLGLTPEEIALLEQAQAAPPDLPPPAAEAPADPAPAPEQPQAAPPAQAAPSEESELSPFSLSDLGLSPEEIALLEQAQSSADEAPKSGEKQTMSPFSLADLGLSANEIAMLEQAARAEAQAEAEAKAAQGKPGTTPSVDAAVSDDMFDFGMADAAPVEKVTKRTAPKIEEPAPKADPADTGFTPEPLDNLDDIWHLPDVEPEPAGPARVVLPPLSERKAAVRSQPRDAMEPPRNRGLSRDDERFARRESSGRRERPEGRPPRSERRERRERRGAGAAAPTSSVQEFMNFLPTGDSMLDDYLNQLDAEPDNYGLALAIGNLCARTGKIEIMNLAFKRLIRSGEGLEHVVTALEGLTSNVSEATTRTALFRLLGDAYSKQGRLNEAMNAYNSTFAQ
ncbi:RNA polymerase sigma factor region1.1 domain-containing protein, partial [Candidatus Viridilinea mediisalina]